MHRVAVYGTLKKPYWNHRIISDQKFIAEDMVEFSEIDCVWFPRAKFDTWTWKWLMVEIYEVDDEAFARCDRLEWNWHFYNRKEVKTKNWLTAWIYEIMWTIRDDSEKFLINNNIYNWSRWVKEF